MAIRSMTQCLMSLSLKKRHWVLLFSYFYLNSSREIVVVAVVLGTGGGVGEVSRVQFECGDGNSMD